MTEGGGEGDESWVNGAARAMGLGQWRFRMVADVETTFEIGDDPANPWLTASVGAVIVYPVHKGDVLACNGSVTIRADVRGGLLSLAVDVAGTYTVEPLPEVGIGRCMHYWG